MKRGSTWFKRDTDTGRILNGSPKQHKGVRNEKWPELAPNITGEDHERPAHQLRPQEARTELRQALREDQGVGRLVALPRLDVDRRVLSEPQPGVRPTEAFTGRLRPSARR